jgi:hypothetical protein
MATVASATITITDHTKPGRSLYDLLENGSGTSTGYTVVGGFTGDVSQFSMVAYRSVQADANNSGNIYVGDSKTANDGSRQGVALAKAGFWSRDNPDNCESLANVYVRGGVDNDKFNVMVETN